MQRKGRTRLANSHLSAVCSHGNMNFGFRQSRSKYDFSECMSNCRDPGDFSLLREDYPECLHHAKEVGEEVNGKYLLASGVWTSHMHASDTRSEGYVFDSRQVQLSEEVDALNFKSQQTTTKGNTNMAEQTATNGNHNISRNTLQTSNNTFE
ncbi:hypothetical protein C5167_006184 [Papaver somniferum]|uniref:NADH dehydrogenase [ubiquinone] iron-sulfur protein 5 n=1 Tax=Papaver somniferum TaxID=3469 RepID=A0A4Y7JG23_PAPSO|nr:hypothetical protein C5167_006184 [Papaver somniferum]